jgi:hypothetical protein
MRLAWNRRMPAIVPFILPVHNAADTIEEAWSASSARTSAVPSSAARSSSSTMPRPTGRPICSVGPPLAESLACAFTPRRWGRARRFRPPWHSSPGTSSRSQTRRSPTTRRNVLACSLPSSRVRPTSPTARAMRPPPARFRSSGTDFADQILTAVSNGLTNVALTDVTTSSHALRTDVVRGAALRADGCGVAGELAALFATRQCRIFEVPVSYRSRRQAAASTRWREGVSHLTMMARCRPPAAPEWSVGRGVRGRASERFHA